MIACTVIGNIFMKLGGRCHSPSGRCSALSRAELRRVAVFAAAVIIYSIVLQWMPLNVRNHSRRFSSSRSSSHRPVLGEPISGVRWLGIALIVAASSRSA